MRKDITKYTPFHTHFKMEVVRWGSDREDANKMEEAFISVHKHIFGNSYNYAHGNPALFKQHYYLQSHVRQ